MSKRLNITVWVICGLLAALFLFAGTPKVMSDPRAVEGFAKAGFPSWFLLFIGLAEVSGAIGLLIPRLRFYAATGLFIIIIRGVSTHRRAGDPLDKMAASAIALVLTATVAWLSRPQMLRA